MKTIKEIIEASEQRESSWQQTGSLCREPVAAEPSFLSFRRILATGDVPYVRIIDSRSGVPKYHPVLLDEEGEKCFQLLRKDMARGESLKKALRDKKLPKFKNRKLIRELEFWEKDYNDFLQLGTTEFVRMLYRTIMLNGENNGIPKEDRQSLYESYLDFVPRAIRKKGEALENMPCADDVPKDENLAEDVPEETCEAVADTVEETESDAAKPNDMEMPDEEPAPSFEEAVSLPSDDEPIKEELKEVPKEASSTEKEAVVKSIPPVIEDGIRFYTEQCFGTSEINAYKASLRKAVLEKTSRAYAIKDMDSVFSVTDSLLTALQLPTTAREYLSDAMGAIMMISQINQDDRNNASVLIQLSQIKENVFVPCFDFQLRDSFDRDRNKRVATGSLNRSDNEAKEKQKSVMNFDEKAADVLFLPIAEKIAEFNKPKEPVEPAKTVAHDGYYVGRTDIESRD